MLRKSVAEFLTKECPYDIVRDIEDSEDGYSPQAWRKMAELGWMELHYPEEFGGYGDPFMDVLIIMEEMGKRAFPSPFFPTVIQCGLVVLAAGSDAQKKVLLPKIAQGKLIMALAQYEVEASYLETGITMPAVPSGDQYILNGTKMFVTDANIAEKMIVAARTDEGVTLFLVDAKDPGITCTRIPTAGMDNTCEVIFKDVAVPAADVLGAPGEGWQALEAMAPKATLAKCGEMLGGAKAGLDMTIAYAKERVQYGKPIGFYQAIQHFLADMQLAYDTAFSYLYKVAWMVDEGMDTTREISALKAKVNENYKFISERCVHIHGGVGTTREYDVGLFYRRAKAFEFVMGDTEHHNEKLAQALGL